MSKEDEYREEFKTIIDSVKALKRILFRAIAFYYRINMKSLLQSQKDKYDRVINMIILDSRLSRFLT